MFLFETSRQKLLLRGLLLLLPHRCSSAPTPSKLRPFGFVVNLSPWTLLRSLGCLLPTRRDGIHELSSKLLGNTVVGRLVVMRQVLFWLIVYLHCRNISIAALGVVIAQALRRLSLMTSSTSLSLLTSSLFLLLLPRHGLPSLLSRTFPVVSSTSGSPPSKRLFAASVRAMFFNVASAPRSISWSFPRAAGCLCLAKSAGSPSTKSSIDRVPLIAVTDFPRL